MLLGLSPVHTILIALAVTVVYSTLGGLRAVLITDFILFTFAMFGAVTAAVVACRHPDVGGLSGLFQHPNVADKLSLIPALRGESWAADFVPLFLIPVAVQWWSVWYPGSEPAAAAIRLSGCSVPETKNRPSVQPCYSIYVTMPCVPGPGFL